MSPDRFTIKTQEALQAALAATGLLKPGDADGHFGPKSEKATVAYQIAHGLTADGVVGPLTWAALPDGGPMPTLQQGSTGAVVKSLQQVLSNGASEWGVGPGAAYWGWEHQNA